MVLSGLETWWAIPAALAVCGLIFFGDAAAESGPRKHSVETFALNFFSLPLGGFTLFLGAFGWYTSHVLGIEDGGALVIGAILAGRSLREVPWTGVASLAAGAAAGWFLVGHSPWTLSLLDLLIASGLVFLVVFLILYFIELPLRLAGLFALPRPFLIILGVAALAVAGYGVIHG